MNKVLFSIIFGITLIMVYTPPAFGGLLLTCKADSECDFLNTECSVGRCIDNICIEEPICRAVGGDMIQMETTSVLAAGAQMTAAWMIPVIVSGIGFAIVIARKF